MRLISENQIVSFLKSKSNLCFYECILSSGGLPQYGHAASWYLLMGPNPTNPPTVSNSVLPLKAVPYKPELSRDPQRDLEVEETWCGEFAKAREVLTEAGFNATLTHAHPAGSVPLKTVISPSSDHNEHMHIALQ